MNIKQLIEQLEAIKLHYGDNFEVRMRVDDDMCFGYEISQISMEVRKEFVILVGEVSLVEEEE